MTTEKRALPLVRFRATWLIVGLLLGLAVPFVSYGFSDPSVPLLMIGAAIGIAFVFVRPIWGLYLLVLSFFSLHWFTDALQIVPKPFNLIPDVIIIVLYLRGAFQCIRKGRRLPGTPVDAWVLAFTGVAVLSHLVNHSDSLLAFFNGLFRQNLKFILLFYALVYLSLPRRTLRRLIMLFIGLSLVQVLVTIGQFFSYRSGPVATGPYQFAWDFAGGTLGASATGVLALLSLMVMSLLFGLALAERKLRYALLGLSLFIPVVLGEGKIAFLLAPLMVLSMLTHRKAILKTRTIVLLLAFSVVLVLAYITLGLVLPEARSTDVLSSLSFTTQNYERSLDATGGFPRSRVGDVQFTLQLVTIDEVKTLLGYGPGSSSTAFTESAYGSLYKRFKEFEGPFFYFSFVQLSTTLLEYGIIGLLIYTMMVWRIYRSLGRAWGRVQDPFWQGISWGMRGVALVYLAGILYWRVWSTEILASLFWFLAGAIVVRVRETGRSLRADVLNT